MLTPFIPHSADNSLNRAGITNSILAGSAGNRQKWNLRFDRFETLKAGA
jgi:hypothetical protein